jgi:hypothetical protein
MKQQQPTPRNCNHQKEAPERISYYNCIPGAGAAAVIAPHAAASVPVAAALLFYSRFQCKERTAVVVAAASLSLLTAAAAAAADIHKSHSSLVDRIGGAMLMM